MTKTPFGRVFLDRLRAIENSAEFCSSHRQWCHGTHKLKFAAKRGLTREWGDAEDVAVKCSEFPGRARWTIDTAAHDCIASIANCRTNSGRPRMPRMLGHECSDLDRWSRLVTTVSRGPWYVIKGDRQVKRSVVNGTNSTSPRPPQSGRTCFPQHARRRAR